MPMPLTLTVIQLLLPAAGDAGRGSQAAGAHPGHPDQEGRHEGPRCGEAGLQSSRCYVSVSFGCTKRQSLAP